MRYRMIFSKTKAMRFTGHLDLYRALERTMRRANLPLAYSEGYNPHPKLMLAAALPLGFTSEHEVGDFWLKETLPLADVNEMLVKALPPGVQIHEISEVELRAPKLQNIVTTADYIVTVLDFDEDLPQKVTDLLAADELIVEKVRKGKTRTYDFRERIVDIQLQAEDTDGHQCMLMHLTSHQEKNGRPDEVLKLLDIDPLACRIHRTRIDFQTE